jgi:YVTN family beta-propeller protein
MRHLRLLTVTGSVLVAWTLAGPPLRAATLVVANKSEATVSLVDLASRAVRATLPTAAGPHEVAVSPDGRTAIVSGYGPRGTAGSTLSVVDLPARRIARTIQLAPYSRPHGIAWTGDGRRLLVTAEADRALLVVDPERAIVERALLTGAELSHMVVASPDGRRAYVANIGSGSVTVFDLTSGQRLAEVRTGPGAEGIALTRDAAELWVANREADSITVVDTTTLAPQATLSAPAFPIRLAATPDGRSMLVTCAKSGDLAVFSVAEHRLTRRVPLPATPAASADHFAGDRFGTSSVPVGLVIDAEGRRAYVAHSNADLISVVDLTTWSKILDLRAGREPDGLGLSPWVLGATAK